MSMYDARPEQGASPEQAAMLRAVAEAVEDASRRLDLRVESLHFEGPAAVRLREAMTDRHRRAQRVGEELRQLAQQAGASGTEG
jgi:hypothetical protein